MEAQGNLLADYFVLKHLNTPNRVIQRQHVKDLTLYEEVLSEFLKNPSDRKNLP